MLAWSSVQEAACSGARPAGGSLRSGGARLPPGRQGALVGMVQWWGSPGRALLLLSTGVSRATVCRERAAGRQGEGWLGGCDRCGENVCT